MQKEHLSLTGSCQLVLTEYSPHAMPTGLLTRYFCSIVKHSNMSTSLEALPGFTPKDLKQVLSFSKRQTLTVTSLERLK